MNPRRRNPGVGVRMTREVQEACDKINWGKVEEVLVTIKPWVRVDGTLNRSDGDDIYLRCLTMFGLMLFEQCCIIIGEGRPLCREKFC